MQGRCHVYEGHAVSWLGFPVRVMRALGAELLIVSNASGGLNPRFAAGDLMLIADHINLLRGGDAAVGWSPGAGRRGRTTASPYDPSLIRLALAVARREDFAAHQGVYVAVTGPNYETRAEYRFLRCIGGDAVGMSTVPEVIAAAGCGMRVLAVSVLTNVAAPDAPRPVESAAVIAAAAAAAVNLEKIVAGVLEAQVLDSPP
jgi:purine-nucleoside phosphorylase